ncbi:hypothetical protein ILUMI_18112 [Ignelater luminosus]|uniref:Uncharacterized protein n=1 Tax=Ignelater luminosus TaxID=2038154 RepID=A0A8K0G6V7_IGNLU|nr:hypothetical protein ILUMI_18112 [Ignelater luminosus]
MHEQKSKKCGNLREYNRWGKTDLPYVSLKKLVNSSELVADMYASMEISNSENSTDRTFNTTTEEIQNKNDDINTSAVEGIMSIEGGYYNLEEFLSSLSCCKDRHDVLSGGWEKIACEKM